MDNSFKKKKKSDENNQTYFSLLCEQLIKADIAQKLRHVTYDIAFVL